MLLFHQPSVGNSGAAIVGLALLTVKMGQNEKALLITFNGLMADSTDKAL